MITDQQLLALIEATKVGRQNNLKKRIRSDASAALFQGSTSSRELCEKYLRDYEANGHSFDGVKLTDAQLELVRSTTEATVRLTPGRRFADINKQVQAQIGSQISGEWSFRYVDRALQTLRKAGVVQMARQRWTAVSK